VSPIEPRWSSRSFLAYAGALTLGLSGAGWVAYFGSKTGAGADVVWALLLFLVLAGAAEAFAGARKPVLAGLFAFTAVAAAAGVAGALARWFGWSTGESSFHGFHGARLLVELVWLAAAAVALRRFRFPLIVFQIVLAAWLLVADLLSGGGGWTAVLTMLIGIAYLLAAVAVDGGSGRPYGFWLHVAAGLLIGGGAIWLLARAHTVGWLLVVAAAIGYVLLARTLARSSWAVLGVLGLFIASDHFVLAWTHISFFFTEGASRSRPWLPPLVFTCMGVLVVALALVSRRQPEAG
jgi:hypothetical protein